MANTELKKINYELKRLSKDLIRALELNGIEGVDLYYYITVKDNLLHRKNKLTYLKAIDIK